MAIDTKEFEPLFIGGFLQLPQLRRKIANSIQPQYFQNEQTQSIYSNMLQEYEKFPKADAVALTTGLTKEQKSYCINATQDPLLEIKLTDDTFNSFIEKAKKNVFEKEIDNLKLEGELNPVSVEIALSKINSLQKISEDSYTKYIENYYNQTPLMPTHYPLLDNKLGGGFRKGTVATIGARPSVGKTALALNIVNHNKNSKQLFFSLEMTSEMIYDRLVANELNIPYSITSNHQMMKPEQIEKLINCLDQYYGKLKIVDNVYNIEDIVREIYSTAPDMAIIDFIQIITTTREFKDPRTRIDYISQQLKKCAKDTGCSILTLSQLTRKASKEPPTMSDLKESGGLEQDSDYIMLLDRPYVNDKTSGDYKPTQAILTLDKNKFGSVGIFNFFFDGMYQRFTESKEQNILQTNSQQTISTQTEIARPINRVYDVITDNANDLPF